MQTSSGRPENALQDPSQDNACHQGRQKETSQEAEGPGCLGRRVCPDRSERPSGPARFQRDTNGQPISACHGSSPFLPSPSSCCGSDLTIPLNNLRTTSTTPPFPKCLLSNRVTTPHVVLCRQTLWCTLLPHRTVLYSFSCNGFLLSIDLNST